MGKKIKVAKRHVDLPKPYNVHVMAEIERQTAKGAAIAATAYLDLLLRAALETIMRRDADILAHLFENRGALESFSSRIQAAYALKVIGDGAYADLCIMRDIRNAFAHSAESFEFDRQDIAAKCADLWYTRIPYRGKPTPTDPRGLFIRGFEHLASGLWEVTHEILSKSRFIHLGPPRKIAPDTSPKIPKQRVSRGPIIPSQKS